MNAYSVIVAVEDELGFFEVRVLARSKDNAELQALKRFYQVYPVYKGRATVYDAKKVETA